MKNSIKVWTLFSAFLLLITAVGCKKANPTLYPLPTLTGVTDLNNRSVTLNAVSYGDWIILKGTNLSTTYKVDFNSVLAADSLFYADDTSVTVKIPSVLPDPARNPITVTTKYGSATLNFMILQPPPVINSFDPMAGPTGQTVTITGNYFGGVTAVNFGSIPATILSSTNEQIQVSVPAGVTWSYITVTTLSGSVTSSMAYGFSYVVYDDAAATGWSNTSFSATTLLNNTTPVRRGTASIKTTCTSTFGALRVSKASPAVSLAGMRALKCAIFVPAASVSKKVKISINGQSATGITITFAKEGWNDYQIPLTNLGNPTTLSSITFQEFSGLRQEFFVDDLGFF
jgi:hypothetical protein